MAVGIRMLRNRNMIVTGVRKGLLDLKLVRGVSSTGEAMFSENPSFSMINEKNLYSMTDAPDFPELSVSDRKILKALQENGRLSNAELARQVGLSESACWGHPKRSEERRVGKEGVSTCRSRW